MIDLQVTENGNLKIVLEDKEEFLTQLESYYNDNEELEYNFDDDNRFWDIMDSAGYIGNGWEYACPLYGMVLTERPAITNDFERDENGNMLPHTLWTYDDYMIKSFMRDLYEQGEVEFIKYE